MNNDDERDFEEERANATLGRDEEVSPVPERTRLFRKEMPLARVVPGDIIRFTAGNPEHPNMFLVEAIVASDPQWHAAHCASDGECGGWESEHGILTLRFPDLGGSERVFSFAWTETCYAWIR